MTDAFTSTAATYRSSVKPVGVWPIEPNQSGCCAFISTCCDLTIRSGVPMRHDLPSGNVSGGGISAGFPCGAPVSAHVAIFAISSSLSEKSSLKC